MESPSYQDFCLKPFTTRSNRKALIQISNTLIPYGLLWWLMLQATEISPWLTPPFLIILSLFSLRSFSLMHDCGHGSLFETPRLNRVFGFLFGVINAVPQLSWSIDHAYHHKTNGDWERYRGVADFLSLDEFLNLRRKEQRIYTTIHHPLMALPGGFYYLAIKPRLDLLVGLVSPKNRMWGSREEFNDLCLSNFFSLIGVVCLGSWIGFGLFLSLYSIILCLTASSLIYVFYVQHIFENSYANPSEGWSPIRGALEGSSLLILPPLLQWFTANIGFHNIHHLCERIPNYNLEDCHQHNQDLLRNVPTLQLRTMLECSKFLLWDPENTSLITIPTINLPDDKSSTASKSHKQKSDIPMLNS